MWRASASRITSKKNKKIAFVRENHFSTHSPLLSQKDTEYLGFFPNSDKKEALFPKTDPKNGYVDFSQKQIEFFPETDDLRAKNGHFFSFQQDYLSPFNHPLTTLTSAFPVAVHSCPGTTRPFLLYMCDSSGRSDGGVVGCRSSSQTPVWEWLLPLRPRLDFPSVQRSKDRRDINRYRCSVVQDLEPNVLGLDVVQDRDNDSSVLVGIGVILEKRVLGAALRFAVVFEGQSFTAGGAREELENMNTVNTVISLEIAVAARVLHLQIDGVSLVYVTLVSNVTHIGGHVHTLGGVGGWRGVRALKKGLGLCVWNVWIVFSYLVLVAHRGLPGNYGIIVTGEQGSLIFC